MTTPACVLLCAWLAPTGEGETDSGLAVTTLDMGSDSVRTALRDMDGNGTLDLVSCTDDGVRIRLLRPDGTYHGDADLVLEWPSSDVGWTLADVQGDAATELVLLVDGSSLRVHGASSDRTFDEGAELLADAGASVPRGIRRMDIARDVDGDGRLDFVIAGPGEYRIHRALPDGGLAAPLHVSFEADVSYQVGDPDRLDGRFAEEVYVPWFRLQDVDGDGRTDLVSETEEVVLFHLAQPELTPQATWRLDMATLRSEVEREGFDLDNLFGNLDPRVTWRIADVDGKAPHDLVLQQGGTFRLYLGGSVGGIDRPPDMLLKSSGNVLHYLLRDVLGDALPELQIIRAETVSLAQVVRWLVLPGALHFDVYTYLNEGGRFSKQPARRARVTLEIPRLLAFAEEFEKTEEAIEERLDIPARRFCLDGDGLHDDVVDVRDGQVLFFRDVAGTSAEESLETQLRSTSLDGLLEVFILQDLDRLEDGVTRTIDLADIRELRLTSGHELRLMTSGHEPIARHVLPPMTDLPELHALDLDGDGTSDAIVTGHDEGGSRILSVLVARWDAR